jgi:cytochrome c peroxidase
VFVGGGLLAASIQGDWVIMRRGTISAVIILLLSISFLLVSFSPRSAYSFPLSGDQTVLPAGTELNEESLERPREVFRSEAIGGFKSYLVNLGDLAFNSPGILGDIARRAGISCGTCHVNGAGNSKLFVPGMSTRPGNFDTTGPLFNPKAHNGARDPVRIPSLRGARSLAPYGNDGRISSLREFVRNVIVNEFAGAEPSPAILDAMVAYIEDIDFLPNLNLAVGRHLTARASAAERRGEALFSKPFPHDAQLSCAACHIPSSGFIDHKQHSVGSGGLFKTPTLLNANFNAPYFHDGRYDTYDQVVAHFDRAFELGLSSQDRADLVAYLQAIGDGLLPYEHDAVTAQLKEINDFASVLGIAIPAHDLDVIALAVDTIGRELRELIEQFPGLKDTTVKGGNEERLNARKALKDLVLIMRQIGIAASAGRFDEAATGYQNYRKLTFAAVPIVLKTAEPWSLFNPDVHKSHFDELRQLLQSAHKLSQGSKFRQTETIP